MAACLHLDGPRVRIGHLGVLDAHDGVVELLGQRADGTAVDDHAAGFVGELTAAVPVPKTSSSVPASWAASTSSMEICRSLTWAPQSLSSVSTESRVTPGRMVPPSGGVTTSPAIRLAA